MLLDGLILKNSHSNVLDDVEYASLSNTGEEVR